MDESESRNFYNALFYRLPDALALRLNKERPHVHTSIPKACRGTLTADKALRPASRTIRCPCFMQPDPSLYAALPEQHAAGAPQRGVDRPQQPLTIAFGIDNAFALPLAATLHSLLDGLSGNAKPHLYIMRVAGRGLSTTNKERLHRVVRGRAVLHWPTLARLPIDPALLATSAQLSLATHYRIFLPGLLPPTCSRVLYLDADVIVRGDVSPLWETDMKGHVVMAVRDPAIFNVASPMGIMTYRELGIAPDAPYFNGGVLLVDIEKWREERMTERFLDFSTTYGSYARWGDQDGLNAIMQGRWGALDERWNIQTFVVDGRAVQTRPDHEQYVAGLRAREEVLTSGSHIIHYTQGRKPWHPWCTHPYRSLFHRHFRASGCFSTSLGYGAWYALRYGTWVYKKLTTRKTWKKIWRRTWRKAASRRVGAR